MRGAKSKVTGTPAGTISVRPVRTRGDRRQFVDLPYRLYRDVPNWVAPLRRDQYLLLNAERNAFFQHGRMQLYLAHDEHGQVVGRVAAIVNGQHLSRYDDRTGFIGFLEHPDDPRIASALIDAACEWLRAAGLLRVMGPVNPTLNDTSGCLVSGFDSPPSIYMPYNLPHHEPAYLAAGFSRAMTQRQYFAHWKHLDRERLARGLAAVQRRHPDVRLRRADARQFFRELPILRDLYTRAFEGGWGFVAPTEAEFLQMARAMRSIVDDRIVFVLEKSGRPIGFSLSLPNVNQLLAHVPNGRLLPFGLPRLLLRGWLGQITEFRTVLLGVLPELRRRGLDAFLVLSTIEEGRRAGYSAAHLGWVADDNIVLKNSLARLGAVMDKEYALFERPL